MLKHRPLPVTPAVYSAYLWCLSTKAAKASIYCLQHRLQRFLDEIALVVERVADTVQIDLGLPHDRAGNARQDVLQSLGRADARRAVPANC